MAQIKLKQVDSNPHKTVSCALDGFLRHCRLKNLTPYSIRFYEDNIHFFLNTVKGITYVNEITQQTVESFIDGEMNRGSRVTSINARLRALFVFLRYCFDQKYLDPFPLERIREDETNKEPYTDGELVKLLQRPKGETWAEWRTWAVENLLIATGIRASTVVNIKISDVDFDNGLIHLRKLKNRKLQSVPISSSLNEVLKTYLNAWEWEEDDYLFPGHHKEQLQPHSLEMSVRRYNLDRGVTKTSTHLFRHTFAKHYILAGGSMIQLQAILGHSTLDMTRKYINLYGTDIHRDFDRFNPLNRMIGKVEQET